MATEADDAPFSISVEGESTGEKYMGDFRAKTRLSHRDQLRKDQVRRDLLGGQAGAPTERASSTAMILAELAVRLTKRPIWWEANADGLDLADDNVIGVVFDKAMEVEAKALAEKKKKAAEAIEEMRKEAAEKAKDDK